MDAPGPIAANENRQSRCGQLNSNQVTESQKMSSWHCCMSLCDGELTHQPGLQSGSPTMMCDLACGKITEHIRAGQTRAVFGVAERADLSPRGEGGGGKKGQDKRQRCQELRNRRNVSVV